MAESPRPDRTPTDPAGGEGAWGPSPWFLAIAAGIVAGGLAWWWLSATPSTSTLDDATSTAVPAASASASGEPVRVAMVRRASSPAAPAVPATLAAPPRLGPPATGAASAPLPRIPRVRDPNGDQTPDLADYVNEGENPTMAQVIDRLHQAGIYTGLGAFSPPGTRPNLVGLAVPEGFVLPEGYVRHYQATDDGQRIEPILMFSPDYQFLDAAHRPIAIPADRVVPPEMAPPGLPIRRIVIPAPLDASRPGS